MSQPARSILALIVFLVVLSVVSSSGRGGPIMAAIFAIVGIPAVFALIRGAKGQDD